jgi:hypothetical protein
MNRTGLLLILEGLTALTAQAAQPIFVFPRVDCVVFNRQQGGSNSIWGSSDSQFYTYN